MSVVIEALPKLDFTEALKDSPRFRQAILAHEQYFAKLDSKLTEVLQLLNSLAEHGKNYVNDFFTLSAIISQLCYEFLPQDPSLLLALKSLSDVFAQVAHIYKSFVEQSHLTIAESLISFLKNERSKVTETRCHFESLSNSLDEALAKRAAVHRARPTEIADARNALTAVGTCFAHTALDYVAQINIAHAHKDYTVLDALWSFVKECSTFFVRGHVFFDEWTAVESGAIADTSSLLANKSKYVKRKMQDRHALVPKEVFLHPTGISPEDDVVMEGYLFKRATNAFKTWHRRWFQIKDNKLIYSHRSDAMETPTIMESDLKLCLVRPAPTTFERTCCFELVTPAKNHLLQADSDTLCNAWMRALQRTIHYLHENDDTVFQLTTVKQINDGIPDSASTLHHESLLAELRRIPGNDVCADCSIESPKWASINLGVLLCIECCGIHRSFGVQISKVRSLIMDTLEPEQKKVLLALGNRAVNSIYLAHIPTVKVIPPRPIATSARPVREAWIKAKYIERRFVMKFSERARKSSAKRAKAIHRSSSNQLSSVSRYLSEPSPYFDNEQEQLAGYFSDTGWKSVEIPTKEGRRKISAYGSDSNLDIEHYKLSDIDHNNRAVFAAATGDTLELCRLIAEGFDVNTSLNDTTALHIAIEHDQSIVVEFLLLNGAKVNALDSSLNTALHIAASKACTLIVCQLMKRGADQRLRNRLNETPLDLAIEGKHADIVTLLRVQEMRDEFCDEFNNPMDETVDDVMQDISRKVDPSLR
ncbi:GTP-ase activating protein for Arf containing protein [Loa loa]|uniref:GTP-ase activating protein for Arf containing protein n=1 Tax=Loa loa TaxID=7209 RepID=A0A1S0TT99_LOALO|nr:GTP-ase activating protein for Arf containing protein [Loa loa]EFO19793.1 GTP-ase activating protein for Arf containing protein [Loa loa]